MTRAASLVAVAAVAAAGPPVQQTAKQALAHGATKAVVVLVDHGRVYAGSQPHVASPQLLRFRIGSVTKTFTATIVMQLVQAKKISLGAPLTRYLPWAGTKAKQMTIRDLLDHQSGLANYTEFPVWLTRADASKSIRPRAVLAFALQQPLTSKPGTAWRYSNTNYVALGLVIEAVTKHTYAQELEQRIVGPLKLTATTLPTTRKVKGLIDQGTNPWLPWAAGALVSDATDLARFYTALLGGKLVSKATLHDDGADGRRRRRQRRARALLRAPLVRYRVGPRRRHPRLQQSRHRERRRQAGARRGGAGAAHRLVGGRAAPLPLTRAHWASCISSPLPPPPSHLRRGSTRRSTSRSRRSGRRRSSRARSTGRR